MVKCLRAVKEGQDGLLRSRGLREEQDMVFTLWILTEAHLFSAKPALGFRQVVEPVVEDSLQRICQTGC